MSKFTLFKLDPMAGISYAQYNAIKKDKGSFEDFLLHYNSYEANNQKSNWLTNLISNETQNSQLDILSKFKFSLNANSDNLFMTKSRFYKLQTLNLLTKKAYDRAKIDNFLTISNSKNPLLA